MFGRPTLMMNAYTGTTTTRAKGARDRREEKRSLLQDLVASSSACVFVCLCVLCVDRVCLVYERERPRDERESSKRDCIRGHMRPCFARARCARCFRAGRATRRMMSVLIHSNKTHTCRLRLPEITPRQRGVLPSYRPKQGELLHGAQLALPQEVLHLMMERVARFAREGRRRKVE